MLILNFSEEQNDLSKLVSHHLIKTKTKIKKSDTGSYRIEAPTGSGYTASLIEVTFNKNSKNPLIFSSGTMVLPDKYDFNAYEPKKK